LSRGAAGAGPLLLTGLDVDKRVGGDVHLDDLAILVRDVPGVWDAFDMHHGGAQRLPKGAGHDQHGDGEDDPEQAQSAWTRLTMHLIAPLCDPDPTISTHRSKGRSQWSIGERKPIESRMPCRRTSYAGSRKNARHPHMLLKSRGMVWRTPLRH